MGKQNKLLLIEVGRWGRNSHWVLRLLLVDLYVTDLVASYRNEEMKLKEAYFGLRFEGISWHIKQ